MRAMQAWIFLPRWRQSFVLRIAQRAAPAKWPLLWAPLLLWCGAITGCDGSDSTTSTTSTAGSGGATTTGGGGTAGSSGGSGGTGGGVSGFSLRFFGNGTDDIDRVKIPIDAPPPDSTPGPPADVGADDFTIEFWMKAAAADNAAEAIACGDNVAWINGNIVVDRDRYNQGRKWGLSLAGGRWVAGVTDEANVSRTLCAQTFVLDDAWHHIAFQRRISDGQMWIFLDGEIDGMEIGPPGDISYPDDGVPGDFCGGPCNNSDPFIVLGAEKHDAGPDYPSYNGYLDELRISRGLRYTTEYTPPSAPFESDVDTKALYHFDEGTGSILGDSSAAPFGPSDGILQVGGSPEGPMWSPETPF